MKDVMQKAQELAEAILASDVYRKMKELEETVQADPGAAEKVGILMEKRQRVENLLTSKGMDPEEGIPAAYRKVKEAMEKAGL